MNPNHYCIIMAGGPGNKFWPVSRNSIPKQFLDILGTGNSFISETYLRFSKIVPKENIYIIAHESNRDLVLAHLKDVSPDNLLFEPYRRNTAACIAYGSFKIHSKNKNASIVVAPSDHLILDEDLFIETITNALEYSAINNVLITMGISPTRPETQYGYIQLNQDPVLSVNGHIAYNVKTFTEKPNRELAQIFVDSGEFLWNSGLFVWNSKTIINQFLIHQPELYALFNDNGKIYFTEQERDYIAKVYEECVSVSVDYGIMEKTDIAIVYPVSFRWSDVGTWESLFSVVGKDEDGNFVSAKTNLLRDVSNSIILSDNPSQLVVVDGLKDYMVVSTKDVILICPKNEVNYKTVLTDLIINELDKFQ